MAHRSGAPSARTRVKRVPENAAYDRETIDAILDAALVCHLGFEREGQLHARLGDRLYVHGSSASRTVRSVSEGIPACVTVTRLDGIVLWAGHIPLTVRSLDPVPAPGLKPGPAVPPYAKRYRRPGLTD